MPEKHRPVLDQQTDPAAAAPAGAAVGVGQRIDQRHRLRVADLAGGHAVHGGGVTWHHQHGLIGEALRRRAQGAVNSGRLTSERIERIVGSVSHIKGTSEWSRNRHRD